MPIVCVECSIDSCYTCENPNEESLECCCGGQGFAASLSVGGSESAGPVVLRAHGTGTMHEVLEDIIKRPVGRPMLSGEEMSDPLKGGRLRAQRAYPLEPGTICQWANLKFAGGGIRPIIGCSGLPAKARHHGPDKSTHNNAEHNVHLLCTFCHHRWHAQNDKYYDKRPPNGEPFVPRDDAGEYLAHDPETKATTAEQFQNEIYWNTPAAKRHLIENINIPDMVENDEDAAEDNDELKEKA